MQLKLVLEPKESEAVGKHFPYANGQWPKALRNSSTAESLNFGILLLLLLLLLPVDVRSR